MPTKVFFCEEIGEGIAARGFKCKCEFHFSEDAERVTRAVWKGLRERGVASCPQCGATCQQDSACWSPILRRVDTGEEVGVREKLPPGACYDRTELHHYRAGFDGRSLTVVLPNGHHWYIDGRASNCTRPDDKKHRCWCRHGRPEDGTIHVDKNGDTCSAGAGSIAVRGYHGFLHNGYLTDG